MLVNNAVADQRHNAIEVTEAFWERAMAISLKCYFFAALAVAVCMKVVGGGSIINFSSISYMMGNAGYTLYTTANLGINGLAREFGSDRILLNALTPGWVLRKKDVWLTPEGLSAHLAQQCLPDPLESVDIVGDCLFLAFGAVRAVTRQALIINGSVVVTG